ncbi:MAG TPA: hypothetical protein VFR38_13415 [Gaiellaceae bacterium]|nr:hypothetical protein [Gaiellaceae bacterium]
MDLEPQPLARRRALSLAALAVGLVAYAAGAERLPGLPSGLDVLFHSAVVFPVFASMIWIALPLANAGNKALLGIALVSGVTALTLTFLDVDSAANVAKLATYAIVGFWFLTLFEELWWIALVAVLVPWVDIWSVAAGPTEYVVEQQPGLFERISVEFPNPGETATVNIGPPDILFFALFLAAADRFGLRVAWTWIGMTGFLAGTLVLVWSWDGIAGLPALPAVCLGFLLPNADLLWRNVRGVRAQASS